MSVRLYHKNWTDLISIKNNRIKRYLDNQDEGECNFMDNFLSIKWDKWNMELFYKKNNLNDLDLNHYYLIENNILLSDNNNLFNNSILNFNKYLVFNIEIINNNEIIYCIIDNITNKIYNRINLNYIGIFKIIDNNIILINNEEYIYINFRYYNKNDIIKEYKIINIDNQIYFLQDDNYCIKNYDLLNKYKYILYKEIIKINNNYYITKNNYDYIMNLSKYSIDKEKISRNDIDSSIKTIYIKINNNIINKILNTNIIEYYKNFNINIKIIDDIKNKEDNKIYYDIDFVYDEIYNNSNNLSVEYINHYNDFIKNINEKYIDREVLINKWNHLFSEELSSLEKTRKIPKILHFIWLGNNDIPMIYIKYIESWIKNHPDYHYCFWNDYNIPKLINQKYYDATNVYAMKADILRYELLYIFGGVYVDCDFLCIKNIENIIKIATFLICP
jgi:hypothetical protein